MAFEFEKWPEIVIFLHSEGFTEIDILENGLPIKCVTHFKKSFDFVVFEIMFTSDKTKFRFYIVTENGYDTLVDWFKIESKTDVDFILSRVNAYQGIVQNCPSHPERVNIFQLWEDWCRLVDSPQFKGRDSKVISTSL